MSYLQLLYITSCITTGIIFIYQVRDQGSLSLRELSIGVLISLFPLLNTLLVILTIIRSCEHLTNKYGDKIIWKKK